MSAELVSRIWKAITPSVALYVTPAILKTSLGIMTRTCPMTQPEPVNQSGSLDDLNDVQKAKRKFKFDNQLEEAIDYIKANLPITGFAGLLGEDLWLREVLKDLGQEQPCKFCKVRSNAARTKALVLLGEWMGVIGSKAKKKSKKDVVFDEGE